MPEKSSQLAAISSLSFLSDDDGSAERRDVEDGAAVAEDALEDCLMLAAAAGGIDGAVGRDREVGSHVAGEGVRLDFETGVAGKGQPYVAGEALEFVVAVTGERA